MLRTNATAIGLLKAASVASKAESLAKGLRTLVQDSGDVGAAFARGLSGAEAGTAGLSSVERAGRVGGIATLLGGTYLGGKKAKRKVDEARFRMSQRNRYY